ncbi:MAG: hypothetical protein LQ349_009932, partial [Xanthoria aureola]
GLAGAAGKKAKLMEEGGEQAVKDTYHQLCFSPVTNKCDDTVMLAKGVASAAARHAKLMEEGGEQAIKDNYRK